MSAVAARTPVKIDVWVFIADLQIHGDECIAKVPHGPRFNLIFEEGICFAGIAGTCPHLRRF